MARSTIVLSLDAERDLDGEPRLGGEIGSRQG
jgi:hypothetical protein